MAGLAARHAILDVIGCLLTNRCQVEKLLFYGWFFSRFGKLPIFGRFVPQIITPIHVAPVSTPEGAGDYSTRLGPAAQTSPFTMSVVRGQAGPSHHSFRFYVSREIVAC